MLVLIVLGLINFAGKKGGEGTQEAIASVLYSCNGGKTIAAQFFAGETKPAKTPNGAPTPGGSVALTLSDGRSMTLPQTVSADGGRYANKDESFVFWGKGNTALVLENNAEKSYIGCIATAPEADGLTEIYSNGSGGFSIRTPKGYTVDSAYQYPDYIHSQKGSISGVKFAIPAAMASGTNLSNDSYISVESIPQKSECSADLFLAPAKTLLLTDGTTNYSVATSSDAAAGNRYDELVFALLGTNPCIAVRYFIHYGVIDNYPKGSVKEFDRQALLRDFDQIRRSLVVAK